MTTRTLFDAPPTNPLQAAFDSFHAQNPHVYTELIALIDEGRAQGIQRWGVKSLFETLRWRHALRTRGDDYKLNNSLTAFYARLIAAERPDLAGFFETRTSVADAIALRETVT